LLITDALGKTVKSYSINKGEGQQIIYIKELTSGTYRYSLYANGKLIASKQMTISK